jgi:hypothetical protein
MIQLGTLDSRKGLNILESSEIHTSVHLSRIILKVTTPKEKVVRYKRMLLNKLKKLRLLRRNLLSLIQQGAFPIFVVV